MHLVLFIANAALMTFMHEAKAAKRNRTVHNSKKSIAGTTRIAGVHTRIYQFPHREANSAEIRSNLATTLCSDEIRSHRDTYVTTSGRGERLAT
ncbi:Uncharacterized protein DBV15_00634 [Temnothorax longispinosus]|uniref:Secreted protein n=1 Tax=Temnothorax longispinosus TaxID=300112 RepID=A0A4S2KTB9_9HYME|nr:Uncharacterized protein DBV15_00634 [Temnothorax longispinosus]